jgi:hypothetical protein
MGDNVVAKRAAAEDARATTGVLRPEKNARACALRTECTTCE